MGRTASVTGRLVTADSVVRAHWSSRTGESPQSSPTLRRRTARSSPPASSMSTGCEVELVDINPGRAAAAAGLGVRFATPGVATSEADLVIHASGNPEGLDLALRLAAVEATIVEVELVW